MNDENNNVENVNNNEKETIIKLYRDNISEIIRTHKI